MAKKFTDNEIWKKQRWFRKLSKDYKLAFFYIKDMCDNIGTWNVDCADLMEDTGIEDFNLDDFVAAVNTDYDKRNGSKKNKDRIKFLSETEIWITRYVQFQYENKDTRQVSPTHVLGKHALEKLKARNLYNIAIKSKYLVVNQ